MRFAFSWHESPRSLVETDKAVELLRDVEGTEGADGHHVAESRIIQALVALQRGDADRARELVTAPTVSTVLDPALRCEALSIRGRADRNVDTASAANMFHQQLDLARVHGLVLWAARALHELGTIDLVTTLGPSRLVEARNAAVDAQAPALVAKVDLQLAALHVERMELDDAVSAARRCRDVAESLRLPLSRYAWAVEAAATLAAGRRDDMATAARRGREEAGDDPEVAAAPAGLSRTASHPRRGGSRVMIDALRSAMRCLQHHRSPIAAAPPRGSGGLWL